MQQLQQLSLELLSEQGSSLGAKSFYFGFGGGCDSLWNHCPHQVTLRQFLHPMLPAQGGLAGHAGVHQSGLFACFPPCTF